MKQIIILSIVLLLLSCIINNEEVLAVEGTELDALILTDPRLQPQKYCDSTKCTPTQHTMPKAKFDLNKDVGVVHDSLTGMKDKDNTIITLLCRLASIQRLELAQAYNRKYGKAKNLPIELKNRADGQYRAAIVDLITPLPILLVEEVQKSIVTKGEAESILVETFCTINNFGIKVIREFYAKDIGSPLEMELERKTSGTFKNVMESLITGKRAESAPVDNTKAAADAKALHGSGAKPWKLKPTFSEIFGTRSYPHLRQVFTEYKKISGHEIEDDINKEFPKPESTSILDITNCIRSKVKCLADKLEQAMSHKSGAMMDRPLIRILISRSELDLEDIKKEYEKIYKKPLEQAVADKTGAEYRRILTNMIRGNAVEALPSPPGK